MGFTVPYWIVGNLLSFGAQIPYVTLPLLILVAFSCPPFRGRGVFFTALIVANDYACTVSPWPPNSGDARPMRYGMAGSWLFVLPALERLVLHIPEHDFWLLDHQGLANNGVPREMTWAKICWAAKLVTTPRAVGWNIGHRGVNDARARIRSQGITRTKFATSKLARAITAYITLDTVIFAAKHTEIPTAWVWDINTLKRIAYIELLMALSVYTTMSLQFELAAMVSVVFVRGKPEDWPPLFGNLSDCYTVSNVWGRFWHGYVRQVS
ncbi:hypothetical protein NM208_g4097 [Fusarium decemcellulare]|uniref:Uncharacterized protein n=1 Tax=Fusarium decemcellulare TaxID=57161 RepID=A0ACC1SLU4_9HYPO|nr:hypothetical protein NM208_g4097 [Fusarium decemcellulare]